MSVILPQSMQSDLQSNLPVIPNNGNPGGAYNMSPSGDQAGGQPAQVEDKYAWMKPSRYMDEVNVLLQQQDSMLEQMLFDLKNPQDQNKYNVGVQDGQFTVIPLNDYGMTIGPTAYDDTPVSYPMNTGVAELPSYTPVLPGD